VGEITSAMEKVFGRYVATTQCVSGVYAAEYGDSEIIRSLRKRTEAFMEREGRRPRILVSWAGPYSGFFLASLASLLMFIVPSGFVAGLLFQFAFSCNLLSFANLNPLLKLDGYYILMDWLEMPMLRERAQRFVTGELWRKLVRRESLGREGWIFAVFGLLSLGWTAMAVFSLLRMAGGVALRFLQNILGAELGLAALAVLTLSLAMVLLWPFVRGLVVRKRRRAATA